MEISPSALSGSGTFWFVSRNRNPYDEKSQDDNLIGWYQNINHRKLKANTTSFHQLMGSGSVFYFLFGCRLWTCWYFMIDNAQAFYGAYVVCYNYEDFSWLNINEGRMVKELKKEWCQEFWQSRRTNYLGFSVFLRGDQFMVLVMLEVLKGWMPQCGHCKFSNGGCVCSFCFAMYLLGKYNVELQIWVHVQGMMSNVRDFVNYQLGKKIIMSGNCFGMV